MARLSTTPERGERSSPSKSSSSPPGRSFAAAMMEENITAAEEILAHWDQEPSSSSPRVLHKFLKALRNLQRARKFFLRDSPSTSSYSPLLLRSHKLMELAANRLQREFHRILSSERETLNSDTLFSGSRSSISLSSSYSSLSELDSEDPLPSSSSQASDLRSIADCMIHCGHGKECIEIYRLVRRSVVEEGVYTLGFDRLSSTQLRKTSWATLETRILNWVSAAKAAVRVLFHGERILCCQIFSSSSVGETLFSEIASEAAAGFFAFPEKLAAKVKLSPEKMFRFLDMYEALLELLPEIESIFSQNSTAGIRTQVDASLRKLAEAIRFMFDDLESAIQKESSKLAVPGGGLHPLARYVANYISVLADYGTALEDVFWEQPVAPTSSPPSPQSWRGEEESSSSAIASLMEKLLFILLCKLDSKAGLYGDSALGYLFLANNLKYLVGKVKKSKLAEILGEEWTATHEARAKQYAASYERLAWNGVMEVLRGDPKAVGELDGETAALRMRKFNEVFDAACRRQAGWVMADRRMEEETKLGIAQKIIADYRPLYVRCRREERSGRVVRFAPEDLAHSISDLFCDDGGSSVSSGVGGSSKVASSRRTR